MESDIKENARGGKHISRFHWGRFIISLFQMPVTFMIFTKVYEFPNYANYIIIPVGIIIMYVIGYIADITGLKDGFVAYQQKSLFNKLSNKIDRATNGMSEK